METKLGQSFRLSEVRNKSELLQKYIHTMQTNLRFVTPNCDPMDSEKRLRVYKSSATMACHAWCVDKAPAKPHKNRNAGLDALRSAVQIACLYGF